MDQLRQLVDRLRQLATTVGLDDGFLSDALFGLTIDLTRAVTEYIGLELTVVHTGHPITLRAFTGEGVDATSSLRIPLPLLSRRFENGSRAIFYSRTAGAFVDLAADLGFVLGAASGIAIDGERPPIRLDGDLPPDTTVSGLSGVTELAVINRAVGVMIERGHDPEAAHADLHRHAASAGLSAHSFAVRLLS